MHPGVQSLFYTWTCPKAGECFGGELLRKRQNQRAQVNNRPRRLPDRSRHRVRAQARSSRPQRGRRPRLAHRQHRPTAAASHIVKSGAPHAWRLTRPPAPAAACAPRRGSPALSPERQGAVGQAEEAPVTRETKPPPLPRPAAPLPACAVHGRRRRCRGGA